MLVVAAALCMLSMLVAGGMVYGNTRRTITADDWVDHTQEVLTSLRSASQLSERVDSGARLYQLTSEPGQLDLARLNANNLEATAVHLRALVADNPDEAGNTEQLARCSVEVAQTISTFTPQSALPKEPIQRCQRTIGKMMELERRLLADRTRTSQRIQIVSLSTNFVFVGLSLVALVTLFGFLLRGAELRRRSDKRIVQTNCNLEESVQLLRDQAEELNLLTASRDELQLCVDLQEVYGCAKNSFLRLLPETGGALCMLNNSRNMMETVSTWRETILEDCHAPESCCGLRSGQPRWREPGVSEIHCSHFVDEGPEHYVCIPIVAHGDTLGLLYLQCPDKQCMDSVRHRIAGVRQLLQLTGMAVASMKLRIKLENQSIRDPLTNLFNRHFMEIALDRELSRAARRKSVLAVLMLDVDHFKAFNDTHGHAAGDAVLKAVAETCQSTIRSEDIACRYGGEEFTIILPDITAETAYSRAEGIRRAIGELRVFAGKESFGNVTISIGVALHPDDGTTADTLLRKADQALYRAKQQGRDQVYIAEGIYAA
jgi:diguanylate cyclase (GGDEF)-like protein